MSSFIDSTIMKDELYCLNHYLESRKLNYAEISALLETKIDENRFIGTVKGYEKFKKL